MTKSKLMANHDAYYYVITEHAHNLQLNSMSENELNEHKITVHDLKTLPMGLHVNSQVCMGVLVHIPRIFSIILWKLIVNKTVNLSNIMDCLTIIHCNNPNRVRLDIKI